MIGTAKARSPTSDSSSEKAVRCIVVPDAGRLHFFGFANGCGEKIFAFFEFAT